MAIFFSILGMVICGLITKKINANKGYDGGFAWGFFLGLIGIIIVINRSDSPTKKTEVKVVEENGSEQKLTTNSKGIEESLKDSSSKVEVEGNRPVISSGNTETGEKNDFTDVDVKENRPSISSVISSQIPKIWEEDVLTVVDANENRPAISSSVVAHLKRTKLFLEDEEWNLAEEYCEKVLDEDPECGLAYFYKFMAKNRFSSPLKISTEYFLDEDRDIKKALRFADGKLKQQISSIVYNQKKAVYGYGVKCVTAENYEEARAAFLQIEDFEDAKNQIEQCQNKIRESELQKQYNMALSFMRDALYLDAIEIFTQIPDYKDSSDKIKECEEKAEQKKIEDKYKLACIAMQNKDYSDAISIFNEVIDFQDSKAKIEECNQQIKKAEEKVKKFERILLLALLCVLLIGIIFKNARS